MVFQKWNLMGSRSFFRLKAEQQSRLPGWRRYYMSIGTIILIILVIALLGGFSGIGGGPFYGTGYYGGGGLGLVIVILLILLLLGRL
jgi:Na+/melibiose symporter-like transporter